MSNTRSNDSYVWDAHYAVDNNYTADGLNRYRRRNCIEIMFGRLKDWRRVATRYDRCPTAFFSAIVLAATVIFWL